MQLVKVFVAMPFSSRFRAVYERIRSVCSKFPIETVRVDEVIALGDIFTLIEREIRRCDFMIADFTGDEKNPVANPNVALEVGLARGLRKYTIMLTQDLAMLPFDLRTHRALEYKPDPLGLLDLGHRLEVVVAAVLESLERREVVEVLPDAAPAVGDLAGYRWLGQNAGGVATYRAERDGSLMARVPAGPFAMGPDCLEVTTGEYLIDVHAITNLRYGRFLQAAGHVAPPNWASRRLFADHPVVGVTFADAEAYASWAGRTLPEEHHWEKAARGTDGRPYPWGSDPPSPERAAYCGSGRDWLSPVYAHPAGESPHGCLDMAGNVWEWLDSWREPGRTRRIAGGSFRSKPEQLVCTARFWAHPGCDRYRVIGFRTVHELG